MSKGANALTSTPFAFVIQKSIWEFHLQTTLQFVVGMEFHFTIHLIPLEFDSLIIKKSIAGLVIPAFFMSTFLF